MNAIQHIKENIDKEKIKNLLENHTSHIYDTGSGIRSNCVLHHGDNPTSFFWDYTNGLWFCHTGNCGEYLPPYIAICK